MISDAQVRRLREELARGRTLQEAALRSGMDAKTARNHRSGDLPSRRSRPRDWRTRANPFAEIWADVVAELQAAPNLEAKALFSWLQNKHPGRFADGQIRSFQRRVKEWRAMHGPGKEVFFAQVHEPGRLCASDFTHMSDLEVTIAGQPFPHLVYHFVLTYSNWEHASICFSESFESLAEGLQNALAALGGAPLRHRTDRMGLAVANSRPQRDFTARYLGLVEYYGLVPEKTQARRGNENGDVEASHRWFKEGVHQTLLLRGSREFAARDAYALFLEDLSGSRNAGRQARFAEEVAVLRPLPARRLDICRRKPVRVDSGSLIHVDRNAYSVPARLVGERVEARLYAERLEVWYAQTLLLTLPRLYGRRRHRVDYRHVIDALIRKPGAFAQYRYRADLFPTSRFRMAYDALVEASPTRGSKAYLELLQLAAQEGEALVEAALEGLFAEGATPSLTNVVNRLHKSAPLSATDVVVEEADLSSFDALLDYKEVDDAGEGCGRDVGGVPEGVAFTDVSGGL